MKVKVICTQEQILMVGKVLIYSNHFVRNGHCCGTIANSTSKGNDFAKIDTSLEEEVI